MPRDKLSRRERNGLNTSPQSPLAFLSASPYFLRHCASRWTWNGSVTNEDPLHPLISCWSAFPQPSCLIVQPRQTLASGTGNYETISYPLRVISLLLFLQSSYNKSCSHSQKTPPALSKFQFQPTTTMRPRPLLNQFVTVPLCPSRCFIGRSLKSRAYFNCYIACLPFVPRIHVC